MAASKKGKAPQQSQNLSLRGFGAVAGKGKATQGSATTAVQGNLLRDTATKNLYTWLESQGVDLRNVGVAQFGELHPRVLKALDVEGPLVAFELNLDALPEGKRKSGKSRPALEASSLMPLSRDFAFVVDAQIAAGDLVRPILGADKALIAEVRVFDVYQGPGVAEGAKSVAVEVLIQPRDKTLTEPEIEALSARIVAAAEKAVGARLRR